MHLVHILSLTGHQLIFFSGNLKIFYKSQPKTFSLNSQDEVSSNLHEKLGISNRYFDEAHQPKLNQIVFEH